MGVKKVDFRILSSKPLSFPFILGDLGTLTGKNSNFFTCLSRDVPFVDEGYDDIFATEIRLVMRLMRPEDVRGQKGQLLSYPSLNDGWIYDETGTNLYRSK